MEDARSTSDNGSEIPPPRHSNASHRHHHHHHSGRHSPVHHHRHHSSSLKPEGDEPEAEPGAGRSSPSGSLLEPPPQPHHQGHRHSQSRPKRPKKDRIQRRVAETHIIGREFRDPTLSFHTLHKTLIPSVNPVKASIEKTLHQNVPADEFIVHYNRYLHSHQTIDSRHEDHYKKFGLPKKPTYNPTGRRFTDSSESDPDYNREEFKKLGVELNAKKSGDEDDDSDEDEDFHDHMSAGSKHSPNSKPTGSKVHPEGQIPKPRGSNVGFGQLMSVFCCCCKKTQSPPQPTVSVQESSNIPEISKQASAQASK